MSKKTWLAAYLYYAEPWEEFLIEAVQPFVRSVLEEKLADRFFFIRYWHQGPHIRLRFQGEKKRLESRVKPWLVSYFNRYFKEKPSHRAEPAQGSELPEAHQWFPNHSIRFIPYEPEIERYGGSAGILLAEKQFEISSNVVLAVIRESKEWYYDRALGAAIQLHLGFAFALGMDLKETTAFYSHIFRMWFYRSFGYLENVPEQEIKERQEITLKAFEENFTKQKSSLVPYHSTLWDAFTQGREFEQEWLNRWLREMREIGRQLRDAQGNGVLIFPRGFKPRSLEQISEEHRPLWYILESYVHMTNNRLGILNRDEAFLGYLIKESLREVSSRL
ncbi:MAG: thiopeptide-type bacteriocin biosynthesis protein [Candidatus Aminicenantes bacterium]|nr:MAG: thiopeptide-type bacteriocin biosynthesis protein [Candidatus Aminicenantes bacterium]